MVEQGFHKAKVVGSIPTPGTWLNFVARDFMRARKINHPERV